MDTNYDYLYLTLHFAMFYYIFFNKSKPLYYCYSDIRFTNSKLYFLIFSFNVALIHCFVLAWRIISLRGEVWAHKTSVTPPPFIEVSVTSQEIERSCICVLRGIDFFSFYKFDIWFWNWSDHVVFLFRSILFFIWLIMNVYLLVLFICLLNT